MRVRRIGLIGFGAIARTAVEAVRRECRTVEVAAVLLRPGRQSAGGLPPGCVIVHDAEELAGLAPDGVFECAGHEAVHRFAETVLSKGCDLSLISMGALADAGLLQSLREVAESADATLSILPGAIPGIEALAAARLEGIDRVRHTISKPPSAWKGTLAETAVALNGLDEPIVIFRGCARSAAANFPKNANTTAAIALAGAGFERTTTILVADPGTQRNTHCLEADGSFGTMSVRIAGNSLPGQPQTSMLAALSVARAILLRSGGLRI